MPLKKLLDLRAGYLGRETTPVGVKAVVVAGQDVGFVGDPGFPERLIQHCRLVQGHNAIAGANESKPRFGRLGEDRRSYVPHSPGSFPATPAH